MKTIIVDGVEFVEKSQLPKGNRAVVVVDRGWIFAGDMDVKNDRVLLTNAVNVMRWESIGFDGMLKDPKSSKVTLKLLPYPVDIPSASIVFTIPVGESWGL